MVTQYPRPVIHGKVLSPEWWDPPADGALQNAQACHDEHTARERQARTPRYQATALPCSLTNLECSLTGRFRISQRARAS